METLKKIPTTARVFFKRRKLLILPQFQLVVVATNLVTVLVTSFVIWVNTRNALENLKPAAALSGYDVEVYNSYLAYQINNFETSLLVSMIIGLAVSAYVTIVLSHRLSGPMIRMRNYFKGISAGGPIQNLEFRAGDYMMDLPPLVNEAIVKIRTGQDSEKKSA